jgi:two-component system, chemotaxis family, chemotaxis protein CheV
MAGILDTVNKRTQLVGQNRLELLLFKLDGPQLYGINVFKVREVLPCPTLTSIPKSKAVVRGVAHIRESTISIMDLGLAIGRPPLTEIQNCFVIVTEYNTATHGFLVRSVERIVNMNWEAIHPPPKGAGRDNYLTAVTEVDSKLVEIIDVEKVFAEISPPIEDISAGVIDEATSSAAVSKHVLIVDDSAIARKQIKRCIESVGAETTILNDGRQALDYLKSIADSGEKVSDKVMMMISDIEMPEMDGYTLTAEVRADPRLSDLYVLLHTSLSGVFNQAMVKKVGANEFLVKFNPDLLATLVAQRVHEVEKRNNS